MKLKWVVFVVLVSLTVSRMNLGSSTINTREIDEVLKKTVLDDRDLGIIDDFLARAIGDLVNTRDLASIARFRAVILSKRSEQGQYAEKFSESARLYISEGFEKAKSLRPQERQTIVVMNLLILIDGLEDTRLLELAIEQLKNENTTVRYWAIRCLTNSDIINELNSGETSDIDLVQNIAEQLKQQIEKSSPEILNLIAGFAATINISEGEELLLQIADQRIKEYTDWTVKYEILDSAILKFLESKISASSGSSSSSAFAQRFGQLYSYAIQRYVKGSETLNETQKRHLITTLVETENKCISKLLNSQSTIKRAIERGDMNALMSEHDSLLGAETRIGRLPSKLNFKYGKDSDSTAPLTLPESP